MPLFSPGMVEPQSFLELMIPLVADPGSIVALHKGLHDETARILAAFDSEGIGANGSSLDDAELRRRIESYEELVPPLAEALALVAAFGTANAASIAAGVVERLAEITDADSNGGRASFGTQLSWPSTLPECHRWLTRDSTSSRASAVSPSWWTEGHGSVRPKYSRHRRFLILALRRSYLASRDTRPRSTTASLNRPSVGSAPRPVRPTLRAELRRMGIHTRLGRDRCRSRLGADRALGLEAGR